MRETLLQAIRKIESAGKKFNTEMITGKDNEFTSMHEVDAYATIFEYLTTEDIRFGDYDWDALRAAYEDEGYMEVEDTLHEIHRMVSNYKPADTDETIPLEVVALFYAIDKAFHYPGMEGDKPVLYVDMDNVIVDFGSAFPHVDAALLEQYKDDKDEIPGIFALMEPMPGAIAALEKLYRYFDLYILSTSPWQNPSAWRDKIEWVKKHLPVVGYKRLILSHHKHLNNGDYLVDDRIHNGVLKFGGKHIHFGVGKFPDWKSVTENLLAEIMENQQAT